MIDLKPNKTVLGVLFGSYLIFMLLLAINPIDRTTWFVENLTMWIVVGVLMALYFTKVRFSTLSYCLGSVLIFLHTIGGHYTFANVPFDWVTNFFGFSRNHFDRIAHFSVGLFAFPMIEWIVARKLIGNRFLLITYPIFTIAFIAVFYEWVEWIYASGTPPELAGAYLGSQGDIWDAQKDMLADTLGAVLGVTIYVLARGRVIKQMLLERKTSIR